MTAWETEDDYAAAAAASLPTPTDTPYRTPSRGSRRSSRQKSISPGPSSSPPLPAGETDRRGSKDIANDESISILDPRRFTPTLHANLVAEILALRRDQEDKTKIIEGLESTLHESRGEHESLEASLVGTAKENRSLKRQLALLEGGTSSALSELARERDEAFESVSETRKRLETAQKKIRSQEEDSDRVHELWAKDKDKWDDDKRKFERKLHVAEGRLKTVLEEVAAFQASAQDGHQLETDAEETARDPGHGHGSDAGSIRSMSMTNSIRFSMLNGPNGYAKANGVSLADELDLDEEDEHFDTDGRESVMSTRHKRNQSYESMMSRTHHRNQSLDSLKRPGSVSKGRLAAQAMLDRLEGDILEDDEKSSVKIEYVDTGVQYSPPPSPQLRICRSFSAIEMEPLAIADAAPVADRVDKHEDLEQHREWEIEANQRRKRVYASPPLIIEPPRVSPMISAASQTLEDPLSPPRTPISPTREPLSPVWKQEVISIGTQTDALQSSRRASPPPPIAIPSIQLHPPKSAPATPRQALLPQHSKDASCQVSMQSSIPTRSISVQTEEIRVAHRINLLPPHLQPSSISSQPPSPEPNAEELKRFSPVPGNLPPRNPRRIKNEVRQNVEQEIPSSPPVAVFRESQESYPGQNDDGPLSKSKGSIRRPPRLSSLFAGFDNLSSDEAEDFADADMSDTDYRTALSAPKPQMNTSRGSKRISTAPTSVPEGVELSEVSKPLNGKSVLKQTVVSDAKVGPLEGQNMHRRGSSKSTRQLDKPLSNVTSARMGTMRRAALIQSGVAAHQTHARSPSLPETVKEPPFPIPTRASSRRPPISASAPSEGNRSPTWGRGPGKHSRSNSIRKVRSAAALPRGGGQRYRRRGSRSPPPMSPSTDAPESPKLPPMPSNEITTPRQFRDDRANQFRKHRQQPSVNTANTVNTNNTGASAGSNQAISVVDAIAQTMVGEWMFKYVRRRKSFGVPDSTGLEGDNGNGARHKRWVWLAPYERAVMWSSKQPTSGSALLGKTGRKLMIQSVLDVKDDNPGPRGMGSLFNRSILILTPARALKFTAISAERHYVWLTALSFLAHSSQAVPEVVAPQPPPPVQAPLPDFELPTKSKLRRNGIRDSIRVAKGKTSAARPGPTSVHSSQPDSIREVESFAAPIGMVVPESPASPPIVPRFSNNALYGPGPPLGHGRKRSNTGPRVPPPLSFRGFSSSTSGHAPTNSTAGLSIGTNGSSDIYNQSQPSYGMSASGRSSIRTSDASARPGAVLSNFFDAVGTVRMEAFISPLIGAGGTSRFDGYPDEQEGGGLHRGTRRSNDTRRRKRDSYYSVRRGGSTDDCYSGSKTAGEEEYGRENFDGVSFGGRDDPFRGF